MEIALNIILQLIAAILIKLASLQIVKTNLTDAILSPYYIGAIVCFGLQTIVWQKILLKYELYFAYIWNSLFYVGILFSSSYFFNEKISVKNIYGVSIIILGLIVISISKLQKIKRN